MPPVGVEMSFLPYNTYKEGIEEGKNGLSYHGGSALLKDHHNGKSKMKYKEPKPQKNPNQMKTTTTTKTMLAHF